MATTANLDPQVIPSELRERVQWVTWRPEKRRDKWTKVPYSASTGRHASSTDPDTWSSFERTLRTFHRGGYAGIGFVFAAEDPYTGVDLDHCRDVDSGRVEPWGDGVLKGLSSWSHWSPSGTGAHVIVQASLPGSGRKTAYATGAIEMYDRGRFFTVTTDRVAGTSESVEQRSAELLALYGEVYPPKPESRRHDQVAGLPNDLDDQRLLEFAFAASNGPAVAALWDGRTDGYGSASEADLALCSHLAFWTGRDSTRIDRLFRLSGLWRQKWDERRGELTYGQRTIDVAIAGCNRCFGDETDRGPRKMPRPRRTNQAHVDEDGFRRLPPLRVPHGITLPQLEQPTGVALPPLTTSAGVALEEAMEHAW